MPAHHIPPPAIVLPFVKPNVQGATDFWTVVPTGNWVIDNRMGRDMAMQTIAYMRRENCPIMLGSIARAMVAQGAFGGVEVGFVQAFAEHVLY